MRLDKEELKEIIEEIGEVLQDADKYTVIAKGVIEVGKKLLASGQPVLADVLKTLLSTCNDLREELEPELDTHSVVSTKATYRDYKNYVKAGFSKSQAFTLVLAAIKPINFSEAISNSLKSATAKTKK